MIISRDTTQLSKMVFKLCTIVLALLINVHSSFQNGNAVNNLRVNEAAGTPWPMPQSYSVQSKINNVNAATFKFSVVNEDIFSCTVLQEAFKRYDPLILGRRPETLYFHPRARRNVGASDEIDELVVQLGKPCNDMDAPSLLSDESYKLTVENGQAMLSANEIWGAIRGLETFSQIVYQSSIGGIVINNTVISDFPRFNHRGVMLDTSRHYVSKKSLLKNLDAMAQNKYNVFHWHIVDDPSFPYQSPNFPQLSKKGAYDPETHVYTQSDIKEIIEYARLRGIRVVPEFDSPGHTQSWGKGLPDLLTKCYSGGTPNGQFGPVDPSKNATFTFLKEFFMEVGTTFPDKYIHLGGDEVSFACWQSNPDIQAFVKKMGFTDYSQVEQYYMQQLLDIVGGLGKGYQIWQEVIDNGAKVQADTVVEVWKGGWEDEMNKVTKLGYKTLLATCWYLNYISYGSDWTKYYGCEPYNFPGTEDQKKLIQGGETCMWGEYVDDTNLMSRLWPRASAVAERLWSAQSVSNVNDATPRFIENRCRMVRRGFPAEPINGPGFCREEFIIG